MVRSTPGLHLAAPACPAHHRAPSLKVLATSQGYKKPQTRFSSLPFNSKESEDSPSSAGRILTPSVSTSLSKPSATTADKKPSADADVQVWGRWLLSLFDLLRSPNPPQSNTSLYVNSFQWRCVRDEPSFCFVKISFISSRIQATPDLLKGQQELSQQTHEETAKQILFSYLKDGWVLSVFLRLLIYSYFKICVLKMFWKSVESWTEHFVPTEAFNHHVAPDAHASWR